MVTRTLALGALVTLAGCELDPGIIYRCNPDQSCSRSGFVCDGEFCVPAGVVTDGGGATGGGGGAMGGGGGTTGGGGGSNSTDAGEDDAGFPDAGAEDDAGVKDGGASGDAGVKDAGVDDGGSCPSRAEACRFSACGFTDAGPACPEVFCGYCGAGAHCGAEQPNECGPSMLCEDGGWCWENLWPQGNTLRGSWVRSRHEAWFVGDSATVLRFDGERFTLVPIPGLARTVNFEAVHGNETDLVVVGSNGTIATLRDGGWSVTNHTSATLRGVVVLPQSLGGHTIVVGGSVAARRVANSFATFSVPSGADLVSIAVTDGGTVRALSGASSGPTVGAVYAYSATPSWTLENSLGVEGLQLVSAGPTFFALGERALADGGVQAEVFRGLGSFASGLFGPLFSVPGINAKAIAPVPPGTAYIVTGRGQLFRGASGTLLSPDLSANADDLDPLNTIGLLEPDHPLMGGAEGKLSVCRPPCGVGDYGLLSTGTSRDMFKACGTAPERLTIVADRGCRAGSATCDHRFMVYDPAVPGFWDMDDVGDASIDAGRLVDCVDLGTEVIGYTEHGTEFRRNQPYPAEFSLGGQLQLGGVVKGASTTVGTRSDFDREVYLLTDKNHVWALPDGGVSGLRFADLADAGVPPQHAICSHDWDVFTVGTNGSSGYIDRPTPNTLTASWASSGSSDTQRALRAAKLVDGGELFVSAGDRGSVWYRHSPPLPGDAGTRFRYSDAGVGHNLTSVWVSARGLAAVGSTRGVVLYTDPATAQWVESPTLIGAALSDVWGLTMPDGGQRIWAIGPDGAIMSRPFP